jgi:phosphate transport system permease protein
VKQDSEPCDGATKYFLLSAASGHSGGASPESFCTLGEAVEAVGRLAAESLAISKAGSGARQIEIACARRGATFPATCRKPRYEFFVSTQAVGTGGEGTEFAPWWGVDSAVAGLRRLVADGQLQLETGQRLRLSHREVFTPSAVEKRKKGKETAAQLVLLAMTLTLVIPVLTILTYLLIKAWPALSLSFILENPQNNMTAGGIWAPLAGTFFLVLISLLVAAPVGILAGVYLNEYARDNWLTRIINLAVVNLAGVPSIVHALFGVGAFVLFAGMGESLLAASCTLAVMTLPVIITSTREALAAVPMTFREACWNMGATRWQTIRTIVLPNSISGILTGVILQVSRAAGETAPILFTGAVIFVPVADHGWESFFPYGLSDRCMALSMHLFTLLTQVQGVAEEIQYGTAVVLIGLVLVVNSLSIGLRVYLRSRKRW